MKLSGYFWIGFLCYLTASLVVVADDETDYSGDGSGAIRSFLKSFLRKTAGVDSDSVNTEERVENVTVPKFLRDLYQCWSSMDTVPQGQNLTNNTEVIENCRKAIEDDGLPDDGVLPLTMQMSDTVMTFMNKGTLPKRIPLVNTTSQPLGKHLRIQFNYTLHKEGTVMSAEFRVHRSPNKPNMAPARCLSAVRDDSLLVKLWMGKLVVDGGDSSVYQRVDLIAERRLSASELQRIEWVLLKNLSSISESSLNQSSTAAVSLFLTLGGDCSGVDPRNLGFDDTSAPKDLQPYLTVFFKSSTISQVEDVLNVPTEAPDEHQRRKRATEDNSALIKYMTDILKRTQPPTTRTPSPTLHPANQCAAYDYVVDLSNIGWNELVLIPASGFRNKYCAGHCRYPLNSDRDTTHAYLQTLASLHNPNEIPPPCCAPKGPLRPVSLVVRSGDNEAKLIKVDNLIVESCACL